MKEPELNQYHISAKRSNVVSIGEWIYKQELIDYVNWILDGDHPTERVMDLKDRLVGISAEQRAKIEGSYQRMVRYEQQMDSYKSRLTDMLEE